MKRIIFFWYGLVIGFSLLVPQSQQSLAQETILDSLVFKVLQVNPNLKVAELRYKALRCKFPRLDG